MAGGVGVPTPWWQIPGPVGRDPRAAYDNLVKSAPPGYQYDPVKMDYVPIVGSATDALSERTRAQSIQDSLLKSLGLGGTGTIGGTGTGGSTDLVEYGGAGSFPSVPYGGGATAPGGAPGGTFVSSIPRVVAPDTSAAQAAVFNRAKDQVGQETTGAMTALRSALAARGLLGAGVEGKATANVLTKGQQQLGDTTREQAIQEGQRLSDFAKLGYQGDIEQRGQDITQSEGAQNRALEAANVQFQGGIAERGQDIDVAKTKYQGGITQRGQTLDASQGRLSALGTLIGKLY